MQFVTAFHLLKMLLRASTRVIENKDKINAINVFPVADSDTGSNLANTLLGVKELLRRIFFKSSRRRFFSASWRIGMTGLVFNEIIKMAFENSRGNSGIMMASFLKGFLTFLKDKDKLFLADFHKASRAGESFARSSIQKPIRGTMLDAMEAFSLSLQQERFRPCQNDGLANVFCNSTQKVRDALKSTEKQLKVLKENHVVDAGALGFTYFVYGLYEGLSNKKLELDLTIAKPKIKRESLDGVSHEVIFTIQDAQLSVPEIKEMFNPLGESLDIIEFKEKIKVHIHTDRPEVVKETATLTGEVVEMRAIKIEKENF